MKKGETLTLKAVVAPEKATNKGIKWSSSNTKVAAVDKNGKVKALQNGTATIKATAKDIDKEIEKMAEMYNMEADKIKEMFGDSENKQISEDIAVQKAVDFLVKESVEVEPKEEEKEEKAE